jgi:hypothetical protein
LSGSGPFPELRRSAVPQSEDALPRPLADSPDNRNLGEVQRLWFTHPLALVCCSNALYEVRCQHVCWVAAAALTLDLSEELGEQPATMGGNHAQIARTHARGGRLADLSEGCSILITKLGPTSASHGSFTLSESGHNRLHLWQGRVGHELLEDILVPLGLTHVVRSQDKSDTNPIWKWFGWHRCQAFGRPTFSLAIPAPYCFGSVCIGSEDGAHSAIAHGTSVPPSIIGFRSHLGDPPPLGCRAGLHHLETIPALLALVEGPTSSSSLLFLLIFRLIGPVVLAILNPFTDGR